MIGAKADIIFTMLNAGRYGATEACREGGARQIGNVRDWIALVPDVFIASAIAELGLVINLSEAGGNATGLSCALRELEAAGPSRPVEIGHTAARGHDNLRFDARVHKDHYCPRAREA
jgi:hypothetical protein